MFRVDHKLAPQCVSVYKGFTYLCLCVCVCVCDKPSSMKSFPHSGKVDPPAVAQVTVTMKAAVFILGCMTDCSAHESDGYQIHTGTRFGLNTCIHF